MPTSSLRAAAPRHALALAALVAAAACTPRQGVAPGSAPAPAGSPASAFRASCAPPATLALRSTLYFGLRRAHGGEVSGRDWEQFLTREVTPRFGGLTVLEARGQWLGSDRALVHEESRVVVILHADAEAPRAAIAQVIRLYRERFDQESVLWETTPACVAY